MIELKIALTAFVVLALIRVFHKNGDDMNFFTALTILAGIFTIAICGLIAIWRLIP